MTIPAFTYFIPTEIIFGAGSLQKLADHPMPGKKALIVISSGTSMRTNGYLDRVIDLLRQNHTESAVFDKILPNPIKKHVMEGAAAAKAEKCDFIIGLGGGSSIDAAKAIAVMSTNPGDYWDYILSGTGKGMPIVNPPLPIVAITTTAGTGTEADPWTVITHEERAEKIGFGIPGTFPRFSIVDPELMTSVPPRLTAFQGFDAFFHAAEGFIAKIATPISDIYALKSISLVCENLQRAVENGSDLDARSAVALSNTLSGMVESTSCVTSEHALAHAISAIYPDIPHGAALIVVSIAYWTFFQNALPERAAMIANAMHAPDVVTGIRDLQKACGVDNLKLSSHGVTYDDLPAIVDNAYATMGKLFQIDRVNLDRNTTLKIMQASYR